MDTTRLVDKHGYAASRKYSVAFAEAKLTERALILSKERTSALEERLEHLHRVIDSCCAAKNPDYARLAQNKSFIWSWSRWKSWSRHQV